MEEDIVGFGVVTESLGSNILMGSQPGQPASSPSQVVPLPDPPTCKKRKAPLPKTVSPVWTQFDKVPGKADDGTILVNPDGTVKLKARCKICNAELVFAGRSGTSHLARHMQSCIKRTTNDSQQTIIGRTSTGCVFSFTFNQKVARKETVRYFVREEVPFIKVEKPAFHRWLKKAFGPQFKPPCHTTMRDDVILVFQEERAVLKEILKNVPGKICLTSDLWSSNQKLGYMCITAHYITSDWKLTKRVLSFPMLPSPHTGKAISEAIYANLLGWNICPKIGTLTLDNASSNDSVVSRLKTSLFENESLSEEFFHVRCSAHVINLMVKDGLDHVELALENIRESVKYSKSSQAKLQEFFENCVSLNMKGRRLPLDIPTRWNSTYLMLVAAIPFQKVFDLFFCGSDFVNTPSLEDWKNAAVIRDFLKVFYESTKLFSGSKYVTSCTFCYQLSRMLFLLKKHAKSPNFKVMCARMKIKFDKYWKDVPIVLGLASCMDPRYKLTILELCLDLSYESQSESDIVISGSEFRMPIYKIKLYELFDEYQKKVNCDGRGQPEATSNVVEEDDMIFELLAKRREASIATCKSDLQRYLDQPTLKVTNNKSFDVLGWWKTEEATYPILSAMAKDLLTIPVTTVASESTFSGSGRVLNKYRSCLLPETVEALVCLKDWYQAEEGLQDEELNELEELMEEEL